MGASVVQLIGTAGGFAIGGPIGGAVGGALGQLVGNELFGKAVKGPRIDEFRATGSAVGAPIIRAYGNNRMAGELIWFGRIRERKRKKKVGGIAGFGGQKVVNYEYYATFAVGLQEGPGVCLRRIRINGKTWWEDPGYTSDNADYLDQQKRLIEFGPSALTSEELAQYNATALKVAASQGRNDYFTFYSGGPAQTADPIIQGYLGTSAPAYRDTAYVVFKELPVTEYGGALPLIEFETVSGPTAGGSSTLIWVAKTMQPWALDTADPRDPLNDHQYRYDPPGVGAPTAWGTFASAVAAAEAFEGYSIGSTLIGWDGGSPAGISPYDSIVDEDKEFLSLHFNKAGYIESIEKFFGRTEYEAAGPGTYNNNPTFQNLSGLGVLEDEYVWTYNLIGLRAFGGISVVTANGLPDADWSALNNSSGTYYPSDTQLFGLPDSQISVRRVSACPPSPCDGGEPLPENPDYCVVDGNIIPNIEYAETTDGDFLQLAAYGIAAGVVTQYPLGPVLNLDYAPHVTQNTEAFWTAYYDAAVVAGTMPAGLDYGDDYPVSVATVCAADLGVGPYCQAIPVFVADVIEAEATRCKPLALGDLDTSLVTDTIWGIKFERSVTGREAIEQLRTFSFLDAVESEGVLKFVPRGLDAVATLTLDDLGAHEYGSQRPPALEVTRVDDIQLPREVRVSYIDQDADFQPGQQYDRRLVTDAVNVADIQLGIAMTGSQGKRIATVSLYDQWAARKALQFGLGPRWLALEPTDCVLIPDLDGYTRVRIDSDDLALPGLRKMEGVRDEQSLYGRSASGPTPQIPDASEDNTAAQGPTTVVILDLPPMGVGDEDAGYWVAMYGVLSTWQAAEGFRSLDAGTTYDSVVESGAAIAGTVLEPYDGSDMVVQVYGGELLSTTPDAAAAGTNRFAVGLAGRWVIGTFETVEDLGSGQYRLTDLNMGLFTTAWAIEALGSPSDYLGEVGDAFVMLETASRVQEEDSIVGQLVEFRGVTSGTAFDNAPEQSFTARGNGRGFIVSFGSNTPPAHDDGATHVAGTAPTGEWTAFADYIVHDDDGTWYFEAPENGRTVRTIAGDVYTYSAGSPAGWVQIPSDQETAATVEQVQEDIVELQARVNFGVVAVAGQSNVVAEVAGDTLNLAAGSNITITTNPATDTVTIASGGGSGTVTATGGALTANRVVLGAGTTDTKVVAGITTDGASALNLGVAGSSVGKVVFANATSGTITVQPPTGALGTVTVTIPAATDTLVGKATTDTLTNKTLTSPVLVTPALGTPASGVLTNCTGLPVAGGGTGVASLTAYAPIFGGTTSTDPLQSGTVGTIGQVLTSNGAGSLPTFQAATGGGGGGTLGALTAIASTTVSGGAVTSVTFSGLDLDAAGTYIIKARLKNATASDSAVSLTYNADTTATNYRSQVLQGAASTPSATNTNNALVSSMRASGDGIANLEISKPVSGCKVKATSFYTYDTGASLIWASRAHEWVTVSTNITGITFTASVASSIANGSVIELYKLTYSAPSGTYTPTLFNTTNVAASTPRQCTYIRQGNAVTVTGQLDIDPTTVSTNTVLGISLPIASAFTTAFQCGGTGSALATSAEAWGIQGDATNDRALLSGFATNAANHTVAFSFTYEVL